METTTRPGNPAMQIKVLNVGEGDLQLTYDPNDDADAKRAEATLNALLRQGFAIMVEAAKDADGRPLYRRVTGFDRATSSYLVMGAPAEVQPQEPFTPTHEPADPLPKPRPGRPAKQHVPADRPSYAVARSAGGYDPLLVSRIRRGGDPHQLGKVPL